MKLLDEPARLAALHRYEVLDTAPEAPFDRITSVVKSLMKVPYAAVSLVDSERQWFLSRQGLEVSETARDVSFCTQTIRKQQPMLVPDATLDPRFAGTALVVGPPYLRSYAGVPLTTPDGYNIGALCVLDVVPREFDPAQIEVLKSFAGLVMSELELRRIAQSDQLTGALTRRAFLAELTKAMARYDRHHRPSSLVLLDIDHFKRVNDTYGHPAGDKVLRAVATCCAGLLREGDALGRIGGEEFAILLGETDVEEALPAAERFRAAIAGLVVDTPSRVRVTASFGIASLGEDCDGAESWLAKADAGLYAAKRGGRDRCCLAERVKEGLLF